MSENPYFAVRKQWGFRITETGKKLAVSGMNNGVDTIASHCEGVWISTLPFHSISYMTQQCLWGHEISTQHVKHLHVRIEKKDIILILELFHFPCKHKATHYNCHIRYRASSSNS